VRDGQVEYYLHIYLFIIKSYTEYNKAKAKSKNPNYHTVAK